MFRIERLRLRLIRLPLVAFFETSFSRVYDKTFILVSLDGDGLEGLGECVAISILHSAETKRHGVAPSRIHARRVAGPTRPSDCFVAGARARHNGEGGRRDGGLDLAARGRTAASLLGARAPRSVGVRSLRTRRRLAARRQGWSRVSPHK